MSRVPNEDFFANTTMSFGEHLEELRKVLAKAVIGLVVGFLLGLLIANHVVAFVQTPLKAGLTRYYAQKNIDILEGKHGKEALEDVTKFIKTEGYVPDTLFIEPEQVRRLASQLEGQEVAPGLGIPTTEMLSVRVWRPIKTKVSALNVQEAFMIWLKAGFVSGVIISSPWIFFQIWSFVAAGLYPHEQKHVYIYLPMSLLLFLAGASLAFFFVFEPVIDFLFTFNRRMSIDPDPRISEWISFVLFLPLGFGVAFQLPLVMLFLNRVGLFSVETYLKSWRTAVLFIFVLSMFLTPSDPISMLLMALPLTVLYFFGILLCVYMPGFQSPFTEGSDVS
jgi:sec-independent protein translocase protein TatC